MRVGGERTGVESKLGMSDEGGDLKIPLSPHGHIAK